MNKIFGGLRPDLTPAHLLGFILAGIPVISEVGRAFGIFAISPAEQHALADAAKWGVGGGASLILGDTLLRASRNHAESRVQAAAISAPAGPTDVHVHNAPAGADNGQADSLPSDEEEFAPGTGPDAASEAS